jgi:hypothetical protein
VSRLRVEWLPIARRDLLSGVPNLNTIVLISEAVEDVGADLEASSASGLVVRSESNPRSVLIPVAGHRVVTGFVDAVEGVLYVTAMNPEPDPNAEPDDDPGEYEEEGEEAEEEDPQSGR